MSFLLLKSKSKSKTRSSRLTTASYRRGNGIHSSNNGISNNNDKNPSIASLKSHNRSNSFSSSHSSSSNRFVDAGGGQVQLQRPQKQQKRQINKRDQPAKQQQSQQQNQQQIQRQHGTNDVISMDEGMSNRIIQTRLSIISKSFLIFKFILTT